MVPASNKSAIYKSLRRSGNHRRFLEIAAEAQKASIAVTHDLATAKIAMQIQHEETPKYDDVFIALASFHIKMTFFKALGKITDESGGPYILKECGISIKLINGLSYNKFKQTHEKLAAAFEVLHFERFLEKQ